MAAESTVAELFEVLAEWGRRTDLVLRAEIGKLGIGVTEELLASVRYRVFQEAAGAGYDLSFLDYGRFVDMGVGRGHGMDAKIERQKTNAALIRSQRKKERKPKKWYSRAFYGRLNTLNGVVSGAMVERAVKAVQQLEQ